jgi:two-component system, NarL family, nitrate/nitrite response regulator NarL
MAPSDDELRIRILLLDDHRSVLWGLEKLIEGEHPRMQVVGKATTSAEALKLLDEVQPDIILLDLDLGGENGSNAIQSLMAKSKAKVLVLTGSRDIAVHDAAVLAGAMGVVEKGEPAETILKAIRKVHEGEIWLDRSATGRIFLELSRSKAAEAQNPEQRKIASLTPRERQIVAEIGSDAAAGSKVIAERLHISEHTLRNHIASIYEKLEVSSRLELFAYAGKHGISR